VNNRHLRFLKAAKEISLKSQGMRRQFGCVLVDGKKVLAVGYNKKSHPGVPTITSQNGERRFWGLHAEVGALLKCDFNIKGSSVYIWGQNRTTGNLVHSGPCDLCQRVLVERGVKEAIYQSKENKVVILNLEGK
jgi:deoxycytidylate deaminase